MRKILGILMLAATLQGCSKPEDKQVVTAQDTTTPDIVAENNLPKVEDTQSAAKTGLDLVLSQKTLNDIIDFLKPEMKDSFNEFPAAGGVLALWMDKNATKVADIRKLEETSRGKILKDSYSERGKRMCIRGGIIEIEVDRSPDFTMYHAGIMGNNLNIYQVLAIGDTGDLVANSPAGFCGVVVGKMSYENAAGGTTSAPYLVGVFDLPNNQ